MEVRACYVRKLVFAVCALLAAATLECSSFAQSVEARVASVKGKATRINLARKFALRRGDKLAPGDEIDTINGGRVTIELTDGSMITVQPGSHIIFKDYRTASSLRELIQVFIGRVRIKINHYGGKPNPYRVNSPSASILVRGTEFSVGVNSSGETSVVVYDGLVEVESLSDPNRHTLVSPGHGVLVKPNEDIRFFTPGPGGEIGERSGRNPENHEQLLNSSASTSVTTGTIRNYVAGDYERYVDSLVEPGESPPLLRFTAFSDSHLDSLENPAYATDFKHLESRTLLISSFSNSLRKTSLRLPANANSVEPVDAGYLLQSTVFLPLGNTRWVIGGNFAKSNSRIRSISEEEVIGPATPRFPDGVPGLRSTKSSTHADSDGGSFMIARSFGREGRTSLGFGVDYVKGLGELSGSTLLTNAVSLRAAELIEAKSDIERKRFKLGLTHQFSNGHKLGIFYRHGLLSADDNDVSRTFNNLPLALDSVHYSSHSSEIGAQLRGTLTKRLFYGAEAHWLITGVREKIDRSIIVEAAENERINRTAVSFGLGYQLFRRTVLSADLTTGVSNIRENYSERASGNLIESEKVRLRFLSVQAGLQTDLWRNLFTSVSFFTLAQSRTENHRLFPDRFGRLLDTNGFFVPDGITNERFADNYADFGLGWRITKTILAEYILATSYGQRAPNHILLLRYTFKRDE
ncbi:MAG: FecR domain-containing protein [Acidobacteria bacterium]|nr:FecR domain-containing protein [Acidobacteriota bacterium]